MSAGGRRSPSAILPRPIFSRFTHQPRSQGFCSRARLSPFSPLRTPATQAICGRDNYVPTLRGVLFILVRRLDQVQREREFVQLILSSHTIDLSVKMTSAQVLETSVTSSSSLDHSR